MNKVFEENTAVAVYRTVRNVEAAILELQNSGFDLKKVSIAAKDHNYGEANKTDPVTDAHAESGNTFWKKMLRLLSGRTIYSLPDDEFVIVSGPLSECVTAALNNPVIFGRLSTLSAALYILGIPTQMAIQFEEDVQHNNFLVIANGTTGEIILARRILQSIGLSSSAKHGKTG